MAFERSDRLARLQGLAAEYVETAMRCATRQYPVMPYFVETGPGAVPSHRDLHPAFYGSFDWHSCVEMHWVAARLLRLFPAKTAGTSARATMNGLLTPENLAKELAFFQSPQHGSVERPYGWGWLLTLQHELLTWDDPDAKRWAAAIQPLADHFANNMTAWYPKSTYPQRIGLHPNTCFSMARSLAFAELRAANGDRGLLDAIQTAALRWFEHDTDYPAHYEPSAADFLSGGLSEAQLMSRVLPAEAFSTWLDAFLPKLAESKPEVLFNPAFVSDSTDGHVAHLHGLNLSRAWDFVQICERLPAGDPRIAPMMRAAEEQANSALPFVSGSDYMVEHWLAVYAVLLLS
jgi:hypothetical protein